MDGLKTCRRRYPNTSEKKIQENQDTLNLIHKTELSDKQNKKLTAMTQSREILQMETSTPVVTTFDKNPGYFITRKLAGLFTVFFIASVIVTALLVYYFSSCSVDSRRVAATAQKTSDSSQDNLIQVNNIINSRNSQNDLNKNANSDGQDVRKKRENVRLPRSVIPESYTVKLIPFIQVNNFTFNGEVEIIVNVKENTRNITLHVNDLLIDHESVKVIAISSGSAERQLDNEKLSNDTSRQFFIIHLKEEIVQGQRYKVKINFVGNLNDALQGFYRSSYTANNETRWIATTQFQPTDARRAFPCFDEPALKAKFKLYIGRPVNMTSISNMPQENTGKPVDGIPNYVWDEYQESVPMSTYLVAFVVSDFANISSSNRFSVWTRSEAISQAKYSLEIGPRILSYFEQYFGIPFPLKKVDMIALPDFAAGAMENWGLITYRETAMLYEQGVSNSNNKQRVATVVSHELAHQWFGNLVTPGWWSDLWLNEGFASYVEYIGVNAVEPSWKIVDQFVTQEVQNVFALDALQTSHPISVEVHHPDEINEIFDRISYGKGASLIRMMDHFLTTDVFKRGLTRYLTKHRFSNAEQDDLWGALTEQAHEDQVLHRTMSVKTVMDTWTLQTGFPVVTVIRNYDRNSATVSQERFLLYKPPTNSTEKKENPLWWIPVTYTTSEDMDFTNTRPSDWMKAEPTITITGLPSDKHWVIFNILQTGFYRVNYDDTNWKLLINDLRIPSKMQQISPTNKAQLIDDALNLARAGLLDYETSMNVTRYLSNELDYLPWKSAFTAFSYLDNMLIKTAGYDKFKLYIKNLIQKLYDHVGFKDDPNDPQLIIYKRVHVLTWACAMGHLDCIKNSATQFHNWQLMADPDRSNPISPNLKSVVYCTAIKVGGQEEWDFAWERYKNSNVGSEKELLLQALGCSREVWILSRYLEWSLSEYNGIRKQDVARVFAAVSNNAVGQMLGFNLLRDQWDRIRNYLGSSLFTINNIVRSSTKRMNTKNELNDLIEFANQNRHELGTANRVIDQAIEQAAANIQWMENNYTPIIRWLTDAVR